MAECPICFRSVDDQDRYCPACGTALPLSSRMPTMASPAREPEPAPESPPPTPTDRRQLLPGSLLAGRFRIIERVGEGGWGEVFRAEDLRLGHKVALKFIRHAHQDDPDIKQAFISEVRLARQVAHPNVCRVFDIGEADGRPFLTMEFVEGEDLASLLRRIRRLQSEKATEIAHELCRGLAAIHERGVLHRDLKPGNVMIDDRGRLRITDFGLATLQAATGGDELVVGTPAYIAPEVRAGAPATPRSDLFSLGLVLYEAFTGGPPHEAAAVVHARAARRETAPRGAPSRSRELDPRVARVIARCLDPDPARRPGSAFEVAAGLPGGDVIRRAIERGRTLEPEELVAVGAHERAMSPAAAGLWGAALLLGLATLLTLGPHTRLVSAARMHESPGAMETRAQLALRELGFPEPEDGAAGFIYDEALVERVAATDRASNRWTRFFTGDPPVFLHWHRESPRAMVPMGERQRVTPADPPRDVPGMVEVRYDVQGRLRRLEAVPGGSRASPADWPALFKAAGLEFSRFAPVEPALLPPVFADQRLAWEGPAGTTPGERVRVEAAALASAPVLFDVSGGSPIDPPAAAPRQVASANARPDPVVLVSAVVRAVLLLLAFLLAWLLARRNMHAGRGDRRGATRLGSVLMGSRWLVWLLGGHHTMLGLPLGFSMTLAWSLYDFAFARVFYLAVEPYVRRRWPRVLVSWVRLLAGRHDDPLVGRDVLVGCLVGVALCLGTAAHQFLPMLFGLPPGRPDNVGFVEPTLMSTLGIRHQLAQLLVLHRSAVVQTLGFTVVLVVMWRLLRLPWLAFALTVLAFVPMGLPRGELVVLNLLFAAVSIVALVIVLLRVGLLAAMAALIVNSTLQSSVLTWDLLRWPGTTAWLPLALVLALAGIGLVRALAGRVPVLQAID